MQCAFVSLVAVVLAGCGASSSEAASANASKAKLADKVANAVAVKKSEAAADANRADRSVGMVAAALDTTAAERPLCRPGMVSIEGRYCIDRYEASLVEVLSSGEERPFSPYSTIKDHRVRAVSEPHVYPQGYVSATQASVACIASGKRLCRAAEWQQACRGPENKKYGYAEQREPGRCNDKGKNPVLTLFGPRFDASTMNQPQLNQMDGTLAKTGDHAGCSNGYGVYDMVGNLHEWIADPNGTFYGGYYQDVASLGHGDGCGYQTTAHEARYHDYSTGFRCCSDALVASEASEASGSAASAGLGAPTPAKAARPTRSGPKPALSPASAPPGRSKRRH